MPCAPFRDSSKFHFQNAAVSPLGQITSAAVGLRQVRSVAEPRLFESYAVVYILDGRGRYADARGHRRQVGPGDLMIVFPELAHTYNPLPGTSWITTYLCFQGPVFDLWRRQGILHPRKPIHHAEPVATWSRRFESVIEASAPSLLAVCRLQQLLAEIISGAGQSRLYQEDLRWLDRVCGLIDASPAGPLDWPALAHEVGLTTDSFRKRFCHIADQPPARFHQRRLIDRACEMMLDGTMKDREIAEALGFCDEFYFSRRFKAVTGLSPRQFRERGLLT